MEIEKKLCRNEIPPIYFVAISVEEGNWYGNVKDTFSKKHKHYGQQGGKK